MDMLELGECVHDFVPKKILSKIKKSPKKQSINQLVKAGTC